jgi:ribosomal protein S20
MANRVQALKRVRQAERRTAFNRFARTRLRHQIRSMRQALAAKEPGDLKTLMNGTFSLIQGLHQVRDCGALQEPHP